VTGMLSSMAGVCVCVYVRVVGAGRGSVRDNVEVRVHLKARI
jgi:hypothetical protein